MDTRCDVEKGDPIFCLMDMGVWWPGFVLDVCANGVVSVAFWNENSIKIRKKGTPQLD